MVDILDYIFGMTPDPRVTKLFLMGSTFQLIAIVTLYVLFVKKWGPQLMKNRQGFELKGILLIYNSFQIFINAYIFCRTLHFFLYNHVWQGKCYMMDVSRPEIVDLYISLFYLYTMVKVSDLLDTIFFVLRKRYNQVSFLHFYHHIMMCVSCCLFLRYMAIGPFLLVGILNCFVHTIMYSYYLLSNLWPNRKHQLWWKKYITLMQILQFMLILTFVLYPLLNGEQCQYSPKIVPFVIVQNGIMIVLFTNFYVKAYVLKAK